MGVWGLESYIENKTNILMYCHFRESRLIIDGCNLYYNLYLKNNQNQKHGGDYDAYENLITTFFTNLKDCDIRPYVVLDGGGDHTDRKFKTVINRDRDKVENVSELSLGHKGECSPLLIKNVFMQTLDKLKVPFIQCIEDADVEIAALAKRWKCPVLSSDSDFYIFELSGGVLPFKHFSWNLAKEKAGKKYISTKLYKVERLCASFNNINKHLLPVFACILGNDYTNLQIPLRGATRFERIDGLLNLLSKSQGQKAAIQQVLKPIKGPQKNDVYEALLKGIKNYDITGDALAKFFDSKTPTACTGRLRALPTWTVGRMNEGKMGSFLTNILVLKRVKMLPQVEDFQQPSSNETPRHIRQVLYGLILLGEQQTADKPDSATKASTGTDKCYVTEFDRKGSELISSEVEAVKVMERLQLETLWKEPHTVRLQVLQDTLGVPSLTLGDIPPDLFFVVIVTRFWFVNAKPQPNELHLYGLLLGMVHGRISGNTQTEVWDLESQLKLTSQESIPWDLKVAHAYSQWQSCLWWALCLNRLLCFPLPEPECARLYRGTLVHRVVGELKGGVTPESLVKGSSAEQLFQQLKDAVLGG